MQRLMQALGAYGFLGLVKGNRSFLNYIAPAIESLKSLMNDEPGLDPLSAVLAELPAQRSTR
jgi:hypothetical protein